MSSMASKCASVLQKDKVSKLIEFFLKLSLKLFISIEQINSTYRPRKAKNRASREILVQTSIKIC